MKTSYSLISLLSLFLLFSPASMVAAGKGEEGLEEVAATTPASVEEEESVSMDEVEKRTLEGPQTRSCEFCKYYS